MHDDDPSVYLGMFILLVIVAGVAVTAPRKIPQPPPDNGQNSRMPTRETIVVVKGK